MGVVSAVGGSPVDRARALVAVRRGSRRFLPAAVRANVQDDRRRTKRGRCFGVERRFDFERRHGSFRSRAARDNPRGAPDPPFSDSSDDSDDDSDDDPFGDAPAQQLPVGGAQNSQQDMDMGETLSFGDTSDSEGDSASDDPFGSSNKSGGDDPFADPFEDPNSP